MVAILTRVKGKAIWCLQMRMIANNRTVATRDHSFLIANSSLSIVAVRWYLLGVRMRYICMCPGARAHWCGNTCNHFKLVGVGPGRGDRYWTRQDWKGISNWEIKRSGGGILRRQHPSQSSSTAIVSPTSLSVARHGLQSMCINLQLFHLKYHTAAVQPIRSTSQYFHTCILYYVISNSCCILQFYSVINN